MSLKCSYHPFQQNTLMGGMLINQVQAIRTLGHNIALRQLTNDAQRGQMVSCLRRKGLLMYFGSPDPPKGGHYSLVCHLIRRCSDPPWGRQAPLCVREACLRALGLGLWLVADVVSRVTREQVRL